MEIQTGTRYILLLSHTVKEPKDNLLDFPGNEEDIGLCVKKDMYEENSLVSQDQPIRTTHYVPVFMPCSRKSELPIQQRTRFYLILNF
jgi:hypothetical protein